MAAPLAVLATSAVVGLGVLGAELTAPVAADNAAPGGIDETTSVAKDFSAPERRATVSRSLDRGAQEDESQLEAVLDPKAVKAAIAKASVKRFTTTELNVWTQPGRKATQTGEIEAGKKVVVTGRTLYGRVEIVSGKTTTSWVTTGYLSDEKPIGVGAGLSDAPCPDPGVESGLTSNAVFVYRSVCHAFPQITTYGGYDAHGEHASGRALDIMTSDPALLTAIGDFLREHAAELNLYDVIRMQHIWTPVRSAEGWRYMPDRGSPTANHYDHVHVSTY